MSCTKIKHQMLEQMILLVPVLTGVLGALHQEPGIVLIYISIFSYYLTYTYPDMYI